MGCDPLAVDATCCWLMELDPEKIAYLVLGHRSPGRLHEADRADRRSDRGGAALRDSARFRNCVWGGTA
jgi:hypothetical protein